jgi:hypothetical protein
MQLFTVTKCFSCAGFDLNMLRHPERINNFVTNLTFQHAVFNNDVLLCTSNKNVFWMNLSMYDTLVAGHLISEATNVFHTRTFINEFLQKVIWIELKTSTLKKEN